MCLACAGITCGLFLNSLKFSVYPKCVLWGPFSDVALLETWKNLTLYSVRSSWWVLVRVTLAFIAFIIKSNDIHCPVFNRPDLWKVTHLPTSPHSTFGELFLDSSCPRQDKAPSLLPPERATVIFNVVKWFSEYLTIVRDHRWDNKAGRIMCPVTTLKTG